MIYYFDFKTYFKMVRLAWNEPNPMARRYYLLILLVSVPLISSFHAVCFFLDGLLFPGLWKTDIREPVFVVGHARSGTTLIHRLMSMDGDRFSSFVLYELYFPSLLQKKLIRGFFLLDRRFLGSAVERRVRVWEDKHYAAVRRVHKMGLNEPEEDDTVFYYSCASGFWISKMPYMGDLDFYHVDRRSPRERKRLMRFYKDCVKRQLYLNGGDKIHLSKNPLFSGRVESLIESFPDARFVIPIRNPNETIPSLLKLVSGGWKRMNWDADRVQHCLRILADQSFHTYVYPLEVLERHPEIRHAVVDYRELTSNPSGTIERVYEQLGLSIAEDFGKRLAQQEQRERTHKSGHSYSLEEFGLDGDEIRTRLAPLFERYGWEDM